MNMIRLVIRVPKEDAAFLYWTVDALEGAAFHTTRKSPVGATHRDVELFIAPDYVDEMHTVLDELRRVGLTIELQEGII